MTGSCSEWVGLSIESTDFLDIILQKARELTISGFLALQPEAWLILMTAVHAPNSTFMFDEEDTASKRRLTDDICFVSQIFSILIQDCLFTKLINLRREMMFISSLWIKADPR